MILEPSPSTLLKGLVTALGLFHDPLMGGLTRPLALCAVSLFVCLLLSAHTHRIQTKKPFNFVERPCDRVRIQT